MTNRCSWRGWFFILPLAACSVPAFGGPPFFSNDPDPPEVGQWEIILPTTLERRPSGAVSGQWTTADFNYGFNSVTQLSAGFPFAYVREASSGFRSGAGDAFLEYKRRFGTNAEAGYFGIDPEISFPTGDADRHLGAGHTALRLPVLYQRRRGEWLAYADARYVWHGGERAKSFWFVGTVIERKLTASTEVGVELYGTTAQAFAADEKAGFNVGVRHSLSPRVRVIAALGCIFHGERATTALVGLKLYF